MSKKGIDIILVVPPMWSVFTPPLGVAYLTSVLRNNNFTARCFDLNAELFFSSEKKVKDLWGGEVDPTKVSVDIVNENLLIKWCNQIIEKEPLVVGFSIFYSNHWNCLRMAKYLKKTNPKVKIVFGGPNAPYLENNIVAKDKDVLENIDYIVIGEGEQQIIDLMKHIKHGEDLKALNTIDVKNANLQKAVIREQLLNRDYLVKDISEIPFPEFSDFNFEQYRGRQLPILFTRGCVSRCKYCWETVLWSLRVRQRSVDNVIGEIKNNKDKYGITSYIFSDSAVNNNPSRLKEFASRIIDEKLQITWWGHARIHRSLTQDYLQVLKKSGCTALTFGIESFSQKLLDEMGKNYTQDEIREVIKAVHEVGIKANVCFMVGFPGETETDITETENFIKEYGRLMATVNVSTLGICEGTEYYEKSKDYKIEFKDDNWSIKPEKNTQAVRSKRALRLTNALKGEAEFTRGIFIKRQRLYEAIKRKILSVFKRVIKKI